MKSILISINPQHALNILNGSKTLELRKSVPKDFVGWVYMYVTKGGITIYKNKVEYDYVQGLGSVVNSWNNPRLNGKVVCRWWFDGYDKLDYDIADLHRVGWEGYFLIIDLPKELCLTEQQIMDYGNGKDLYAWHINKLEIFDKPRELSDFHTHKWYQIHAHKEQILERVTNAPQSWQYVWVKE